jgi:hypothetical protein
MDELAKARFEEWKAQAVAQGMDAAEVDGLLHEGKRPPSQGSLFADRNITVQSGVDLQPPLAALYLDSPTPSGKKVKLPRTPSACTASARTAESMLARQFLHRELTRSQSSGAT